MQRTRTLALLVALLALGCGSSHSSGDGGPLDASPAMDSAPPSADGSVAPVQCGPTLCALGEVCCNESCGICTPPGGACIDLECGPQCGEGTCSAGEACCEGCPGDADFCVSGSACPDLDCPPPPSGCDTCTLGEVCCDGCPGEPSFCSRDSCPDILCPPPRVCTSNADCDDDSFCNTGDTCGGQGVCSERPEGCPEDCPGVCGCDGQDYCNGCMANSAGANVASASACAPDSCAGREYCACDGECEPLVDLSTGCICECDDPFNCDGQVCGCFCGGASYRACVPRGRCPETEITCDPGCEAQPGGDDGCLICECDG